MAAPDATAGAAFFNGVDWVATDLKGDGVWAEVCPECGHLWDDHDRTGCRHPIGPGTECNCRRWRVESNAGVRGEWSGLVWVFIVLGWLVLIGIVAYAMSQGCQGVNR